MPPIYDVTEMAKVLKGAAYSTLGDRRRYAFVQLRTKMFFSRLPGGAECSANRLTITLAEKLFSRSVGRTSSLRTEHYEVDNQDNDSDGITVGWTDRSAPERLSAFSTTE